MIFVESRLRNPGMTFASLWHLVKRNLLLAVVIPGSVLVVAGADWSTNKFQELSGMPSQHSFSNFVSKPLHECLELEWLLRLPEGNEVDSGRSGKLANPVSIMWGQLCVPRARGWKTLNLAETNQIDLAFCGKAIVLMVRDNGPIYSSTNSGMTWTIINTPGKYRFPLLVGPRGDGFWVKGEIRPSPEHQTSTNPPSEDWYAVVTAPNGNRLVVTSNVSQPTPALTITPSGSGVVVSWPAEFTGFVLQETSDLTTTNWVGVTNSVNVVGGENQVLISSPAGNNFYRLRSQ